MRPLKVGIVGYGTVGAATARLLASRREHIESRVGTRIEVAAICRRSPVADDSVPPGVRVESDWRKLVADPTIDIIVETVGGLDVASQVVCAALEAGKAVVTANKNLLAQKGPELFALAARRKLPFGFEATVAGGIPVVRAIAEGAAGDSLNAVYGILNGTANHILTRMESAGMAMEEALLEAQAAGYAEADASMDIDGIDARDKIAILATLAFGVRVPPDSISATGIRRVSPADFDYARRLNSTIRLVAAASRTEDGVTASVRPWLVPLRGMLAKAQGANNAVFLIGERLGRQMFLGQGAGGDATAVAVVSDVIEIATDIREGHVRAKTVLGFQSGTTSNSAHSQVSAWYLRLTVADQPGIIARVAEVIADTGMNIDSVLQQPHMAKERLSFVITLEPVAEAVVERAAQRISAFEFMREPVFLMRVEEE